MPALSPEKLVQPSDFTNPTIMDVFENERIFDVNGFPYVSFSPSDYGPNGPQMELGYFPTDDITERKEHKGIVNLIERRNSQVYFGRAMRLLSNIRAAYTMVVPGEQELTNSDALKVAHMGIELPRFLLWNRHSEYQNGEIPPESILLNRALRGFHGLLTARSWGFPNSQEHRQDFLKLPFSAQETTDFVLEKRGLENDLVCAGHWNMIVEMVSIIEGKNPTQKTDAANIGFVPSELLDFSKSLRSFWDVVYPSLERAIKLITQIENRGMDLASGGQEIVTLITRACQIATMANMLVCTIIGAPSRDIGLDELVRSLDRYSANSRQREAELKSKISSFLNTNQLSTD